MPIPIKFETVEEPTVEFLEAQLQAAMQIIAALVLTPEEGEAICETSEDDCKPDTAWVTSMREQLVSDEWRPDLVAAIRHTGFTTNTHPGFLLPPLGEWPNCGWRAIDKAYKVLLCLLQAHGRGEGEDTPEGARKDYRAHWGPRLLAEGCDPAAADWVLRHEGGSLMPMAEMIRMVARREGTGS